MKIKAKIFGDITTFCEWLNNQPRRTEWPTETSHQDDVANGWYGTASWETAEQLLYHGDVQTAREIEKQTRQLVSTFCSSYSRTVRCGMVGFAPHVPNYIAGVPQSMLTQQRINRHVPVLSLYYNRSVNSNVNNADLTRASSLLLAAIVKLERSRTRVNLNVCDITAKDWDAKTIFAWSFKLKDASKPLDIVRCAYPLANTAMERRHFFHCMERDQAVPTTFAGGYGCALHGREAAEANAVFLAKAQDVNGIVISYYDIKNCGSADDVIEVINKLVNQKK